MPPTVALCSTLLRHASGIREAALAVHGEYESATVIGGRLLDGGRVLLGLSCHIPAVVEVGWAHYRIPPAELSECNASIPAWKAPLVEGHHHPGHTRPTPSATDRANLELNCRQLSEVPRLRVNADRRRKVPATIEEGMTVFRVSPTLSIRLTGRGGGKTPEIELTTRKSELLVVGLIWPSQPTGEDVSLVSAHAQRCTFLPEREPQFEYLPELKVVQISDKRAARLVGRPLSDIAYAIDPEAVRAEVAAKYRPGVQRQTAWQDNEYPANPAWPALATSSPWGHWAGSQSPDDDSRFTYLDRTSTLAAAGRLVMEAAMLMVGRQDKLAPGDWDYLCPVSTASEISQALVEAAAVIKLVKNFH